ncbi:MAG TPA: dihydroxyacetone kinase subunit DhaL [Nitrososphaerales archaeon]|nr:dihydroxyacetone kinase subunit DhaL [Nitrososphaerales archaeon]
MVLEAIRNGDVLRVFDDITSEIIIQKDHLTELDSIGGDGDHGVNLERGFLQVRSQMGQLAGEDVGSILTSVGSILMSTVGGSTGSLYGASLIKAGSVCKGKSELTAQDVPKIFQECENVVARLGGAKPGDKTMLDVLHPANEAISKAARESVDLVYVLVEGAKAARLGLECTKSMVARKGRAMYLGNRTLGNYDVGAASLCLMIESCARTVKAIDSSKTGENA